MSPRHPRKRTRCFLRAVLTSFLRLILRSGTELSRKVPRHPRKRTRCFLRVDLTSFLRLILRSGTELSWKVPRHPRKRTRCFLRVVLTSFLTLILRSGKGLTQNLPRHTIGGFRKGAWGITLFPPEKGFPQKTPCKGRTKSVSGQAEGLWGKTRLSGSRYC